MPQAQDEKVPNYFEGIAPTDEEVRADILPSFARHGMGVYRSMGLAADRIYDRLRSLTGGIWPPPWALEGPIGKEVQETLDPVIEDLRPENPLVETSLSSKVSGGAGSLTAFVGTSGIGAAVGAPAWLSVGMAGALAEGGSAYEEVYNATGDEEKAFTALLVQGVFGGTTEAVPFAHGFGKLFAGMNRASGGAVLELFGAYGASMIEEGGQEAWQQALGNITAKYITEHDEGRELIDGVIESGGLGAFLGLFGAGGMDLIAQTAPSERVTEEDVAAVEEAIGVMTGAGKDTGLDDLGDVAKDQYEAQELRKRGPGIEKPDEDVDVELQDQEQEETQAEPEASPEEPVVEEPPVEDQFQQDEAKRQEEADRIEPLYGGAIPIFTRAQKTAGKVWGYLKTGFTTRGKRTEGIQAEKETAEHTILAESTRAAQIYKDFIKARKRVGWDRVLSKKETDLLNKALRGERVLSGHGRGDYAESLIPDGLRAPIKAMRRHVDRLSRALIREGVVDGDLAVKIAGNVGAYITRAYRIHDDPDWAENVPEEIKNRTKAWLRSNYSKVDPISGQRVVVGMSEAEATNYVDELLFKAKDSGSPVSFLSTLGRRDLGILMRRRGIPAPIRELLGEYTEPEVGYAKSIYKVAALLANTRMLRNIAEQGKGKFLFEEGDQEGRAKFGAKAQISKEGNRALEPLDGLYTSEEIYDAIKKMVDPTQLPVWVQVWMKLNSTVKVGLTVGSYMTHVRNFWSNPMFALAQGHFGVGQLFKGQTWTAFTVGVTNMSNEEWRAFYNRGVELGIVGQDVRSQELRGMFKDASKYTDPTKWAESRMQGALRKAGRTVMDLYGAEDSFWKLYGWKNEMARYKKHKPGWSQEQLEKHTAEIVRNTFPTYEKIGQVIQDLRRSPLVGSFVSFPAEVIRIIWKTYHPTDGIIAQELKDPDLRPIAFQRIAGSILAAAVPWAISQASMALIGMTGDDEDDMRVFIPWWSRSSDLAWFRKKDGTPVYMDLGYHDPFAYVRKPLRILFTDMEEEEWYKRITPAVKEFLSPFLGEEVLFGALIDVWRNQKSDTGGKVYIPGDANAGQDIGKYLAQRLQPGTIRDIDRLLKASMGTTTDTGRKYSLGVELARLPTGLRAVELDIPTQISFKSRDYNRSLADATQIITRTATKRSATDEQIKNAYLRSERLRREAWGDMVSAFTSAVRLGIMEDWEVEEKMRGAGVSQAKVDSVSLEEYEPYYPTSQFLDSYMKSADLSWRDELQRRKDLIAELALEQ